ncbi:MAG: NAD-dependent epimerase/dehydratase family protein [Longimicrobiales bacterium]
MPKENRSLAPGRRDFLRGLGLAGAGVALGLGPEVGVVSGQDATGLGPGPSRRPRNRPGKTARKRLLILGGTGFIGPHMVRYAVSRGHEVSIFTRGRAQADIPDVEHLLGDRNGDLSALEGRRWDVVLDNNARDYRWVRLSAETLRHAADQYIFTSSISAYAGEATGFEGGDRVFMEPEVDESSPLFSRPPGFQEGDEAPYGLTKALGEEAAEAAFPGRTTVVRPGLIVGPGDRTDRFTYWPVRIDQGGEVLAPGTGKDATQIIDVRDLTEWIVRLAEGGISGVFNATGPEARLSMAEMLYGIRAITSAPVRFTWVPVPFLEDRGVRPWSDMPAWIPGDPLSFVNVSRAVEAGLTFRPLAVTARDTLEYQISRPAQEQQELQAGITREREREVLAAWRAADRSLIQPALHP